MAHDQTIIAHDQNVKQKPRMAAKAHHKQTNAAVLAPTAGECTAHHAACSSSTKEAGSTDHQPVVVARPGPRRSKSAPVLTAEQRRKHDFAMEAINLSRCKMQAGEGGPFGAVVTSNGQVVARGWNKVTSTNDPTAHAEVTAIRNACKKLGTFNLAGCELYTSCEPCPMCLSAIYWSRVDKVYYCATREDAADAGFDDSFIYDQVPLEPCKRSLDMEQMARKDAQAVFELWKGKHDKIAY